MNDFGLVGMRQEELRQAARRARPARRSVGRADPWWLRSARRLARLGRTRQAQTWTPTLRSVR